MVTILRTLANICDRFLGGSDDSTRTLLIPEHNPVIRVSRYRAKKYQTRLQACVDLLSAKYQVSEQRGIERRLSSFASEKKLSLLHSYQLRHENLECFWITFSFSESSSDGQSLEGMDTIRQGVIVEIPFDAGSVLMRPENINDKISALFGPLDLDFKANSKFSRKYFVQAENEKKIRNNLPRSFMEVLAGQSGLLVRLRGNQALLALDDKIEAEGAVQLADVAFAVSGRR